MTKTRALQLAAGIERPASVEEYQFRDQFRKPNAIVGTGHPGLTEEEYKKALEAVNE